MATLTKLLELHEVLMTFLALVASNKGLGPRIHRLVTAIQVKVYIGNMLSRLSGKFEKKKMYVED